MQVESFDATTLAEMLTVSSEAAGAEEVAQFGFELEFALRDPGSEDEGQATHQRLPESELSDPEEQAVVEARQLRASLDAPLSTVGPQHREARQREISTDWPAAGRSPAQGDTEHSGASVDTAEQDATAERHQAAEQDAAAERHQAAEQDAAAERHQAAEQDAAAERHQAAEQDATERTRTAKTRLASASEQQAASQLMLRTQQRDDDEPRGLGAERTRSPAFVRASERQPLEASHEQPLPLRESRGDARIRIEAPIAPAHQTSAANVQGEPSDALRLELRGRAAHDRELQSSPAPKPEGTASELALQLDRSLAPSRVSTPLSERPGGRPAPDPIAFAAAAPAGGDDAGRRVDPGDAGLAAGEASEAPRLLDQRLVAGVADSTLSASARLLDQGRLAGAERAERDASTRESEARPASAIGRRSSRVERADRFEPIFEAEPRLPAPPRSQQQPVEVLPLRGVAEAPLFATSEPGVQSVAVPLSPADTTISPLARTAAQPVQAIPEHVQWLSARGGGTARLQLHPAHLGAVDITVNVRGANVDVVIRAEEPAAQTAVLAYRDQLVEALGTHELKIASFEVSGQSERNAASSNAFEQGPHRDAQNHSSPSARGRDGAPVGSSERGVPETELAQTTRQPQSRVDLRI